ncbi:energy transducer TonB [Variovorax sp.]|uniref:energy transducer TonB n=2 Tax=Variovorax TaxID=34072 RepID=UPI00342648DD
MSWRFARWSVRMGLQFRGDLGAGAREIGTSNIVETESPISPKDSSTRNARPPPMTRLIHALALLAVLGGCASGAKPPPEAMPAIPSPFMSVCRDLGTPIFPTLVFPRAAREARQDGWVILEHDVADGRMTNIRVIASSPQGMFEESVTTWAPSVYFPLRKDGRGCRRPFVFHNQ